MSPLSKPWLLLTLAMVVSTPAAATTMRIASLEELTRRADIVVVGTALEQESFWREGRIHTRTVLEVEAIWREPTTQPEQSSPRTLTAVTLGGVVGDIGQTVHGSARFALGRRYVVFGAEGPGGYFPVGMWQGVLVVDDEDGLRRTGDPPRIAGPEPIAGFPASLPTLRAAVHEVLHRE